MHILIVDDDDFALGVLDNTLARMGHTVTAAHDGREALEVLRGGDIRLVITDWDMPEMNGLEFCRSIRKEDFSGYTYIIMLTGREGARQRMEGLCAGADDFLNKPLDPEELLVCLKQAERILALETRDVAIFALAKLAESRDSETGAHIERVQCYTRLLAQHLSEEVKACYGVDDEYIRLLYQTSPLHDLGKVGIPDAVLLKPGKLTPDEFAIMKTHTLLGAKTLDAALERFPSARFLQMAREIAATHHEKFDGSGYPQGLAGEQIPLCGRVVAVADVYDALTSRRVYKDAMTHQQAKKIIFEERGRHFDPEVVDALVRAEAKIIAAHERLRDDAVASLGSMIMPALDTAPAPCGPRPAKILVAEDDPVMLAKLTNLLGYTGEPVYSATNGEEAIGIMGEHEPRVVVSDWEMPGIDGVELCRQIRRRAGADPVHFIMLTAHTDKSRLLDAYEAGIDDFVSKPFDAEVLLARVRAGIRAAKLHDDLVRKAVGSQKLNAELATLNSRLEKLSITDELTGLFNRRHAMLRLEEVWAQAESGARPLSVAMIDVDHFKRINDTHGHDVGDALLRRVAGILRDQTRGTDTVCRVGGEEFLIIFPLQTIEEAGVCAGRCRRAVEAETFRIGSAAVKATVSIGLAARLRGMAHFPDLLKLSDQALYAAKHGGRNTVRVADAREAAPARPEPASPPPGSPSAPTTADAAPPAPPAPPAPLDITIDLDAVLKRCGGDAQFAAALFERYRTQATVEVAKIHEALQKRDAVAACRAAHTLKSMSTYIGAAGGAALSRQIEELGRATQLAQMEELVGALGTEVARAIAWITEHPQATKLIGT